MITDRSMGYRENYFSQRVRQWQLAGWLPQGGRLIDFGAPAFSGDPASIKNDLGGIDLDRPTGMPTGPSGSTTSPSMWTPRMGPCSSISKPGRRRPSGWVLSIWSMTRARSNTWQNPMNALHVAHEVVKVGVVHHSVPMFGHRKHGLFNPTPKMWS